MTMPRIARCIPLLNPVILLLGLGGCVTQPVSGVGAGGSGGGGSGGNCNGNGNGNGSGGGLPSSTSTASSSSAAASTSTSASSTGSGTSCPLPGCDDLPGFKGSKSCQGCHTAIYADWESSMHAHSITSPVMIAQANQVFAADLIQNQDPGAEQFCTSCHSPLSARVAQSGILPFTSNDPQVTNEALEGGIGCVTCHAYNGTPADSRAVLTDFQNDFSVGQSYYGPFANPAPNGGVHQSSTTPLYASGVEDMCLGCHNTKKDRNGNGVFELGTDLFLQTTFDQYYIDYRSVGIGEQVCLDCHMPERTDVHQAADGFPGAPIRTVHDHKFAGVDYPLDEYAQGKDPQKFARRELLQGSIAGDPPASLTVQNVNFDGSNLSFDVEIVNVNGGHDLPTGFAFMRQMWLEVIVKDKNKIPLATSGALQDPDHDLCDHDTLFDNLGPNLQGCQNNIPDGQLVNFQTKLVDFVTLQNGVLVQDPVKGHETWLQFQTGGAVARSRPADVAAGLGQFTLAPIKPFEQRSFHYTFSFPQQHQPITLSTKLLFRNLPPYFMRRLAQSAPNGSPLGSLLSFEIVPMAANFRSIPAP
jgi:hypothetical protein